MAYVLSSVSGNLISAASAGYAPTNSGEVSAIASAYAESAASSKLDNSASSSFYPSDNPSGFISGVDLSDYATTAYVDSSVSGKLDTTAQVVTSIGVAAGALSSINGYGLSAGLANSAGTATVWLGASSKLDASAASDFALTAQLEDYLEKTASSQFLTAIPSDYATTAYVDSSISGFAYESAVSGWTAKQDALTFGYDTSDKINAINGSALAGEGGGLVTAIGTSENGISSLNNYGLVDTAALHSADYSSLYVQEPLYISASGESSYIGISGDIGGIDSATCSAIASAYAESAASSKLDRSASSSFYGIDNPSGFLTAAYAPTFGYNTADQISSIDGSALGGMDEAAVSSIASAYAESAISSVSGNYYTTANESGFITGVDLTDYATTAYVDSAVSSKADSSALSSYVPYSGLEYNTASAISGINGSALAAGSTYSAGEGIDITDDVISVEAPVDIVAGPGIVIDNPDGNTLRVSTDENYETVLFEGTAATSVTCSEAITNFERLKVYVTPAAVTTDTMIQIVEMVPDKFGSYMMLAGYQSNLFHIYGGRIANSGTTTLKTENGFHMWVPITSGGSVGNESSNSKITKVVGIHRIANN